MYARQASLFGLAEPGIDPAFGGIERLHLDEWSWVDHLPGWLDGHDAVFDDLAERLPFRQRRVVMYDHLVDEPRLTWWWTPDDGSEPLSVLGDIRHAVSERYGRVFDSIGVNWYRDGHDSVTWHGDRNRFWSEDPIIAIVSVGQPRPFLLRPRGGRVTHRFELGHGDLLVMGGSCQHTWEHAVPKVASAGPRMSITYRHGQDPPAEVRATIGT